MFLKDTSSKPCSLPTPQIVKIITRVPRIFRIPGFFIIGHEKYVKGIEGSIPVLVKSANWIDTAEEIDDLFLGDAEVWRRPSIGTAGPLGGDFPLVTKEGHHVLDVIFTTPIPDLGKVAESLEKIAGVVDHGIVSSIPSYVVVALNGEVQVLDEKSSVIP